MQISEPGWNCRRTWHCFWTYGGEPRAWPSSLQGNHSDLAGWAGVGREAERRWGRRHVENLCRSRLSREWKIWFGECWLSQAPYPTEQWDGFGIGRRRKIVVRSITTAAVGLRVAREDGGEMDRGARESSNENSLRTTSTTIPPPITARLSAFRRNRSHLLINWKKCMGWVG